METDEGEDPGDELLSVSTCVLVFEVNSMGSMCHLLLVPLSSVLKQEEERGHKFVVVSLGSFTCKVEDDVGA